VKAYIENGADLGLLDELGNTALLCAAENGAEECIRLLYPTSPWHITNHAKRSFLDIMLSNHSRRKYIDGLADEIESKAMEALTDDKADPSHSWAAAKFFDGHACPPLDDLMSLTGIRKVKREALTIFNNVTQDLERPPESKLTSKLAMNFLFLGNPGNHIFVHLFDVLYALDFSS
jgi:ankyrin repeat protein